MLIYLIRHGETDWNKAGRLQGGTDIPLNQYGRDLAVQTSEALSDIPFEIIYSSPLQRSVETAEIMRRDRDIPLYTDERLREMSFGTSEGNELKDISGNPENPAYNMFKHPEKYVPEGHGETFRQVMDRTAEFLREVIVPLEGKYETVLLAGHGALNRCILNPIAGIDIADFWKIKLNNCAVSILECKDGAIHILETGKTYYEPQIPKGPGRMPGII